MRRFIGVDGESFTVKGEHRYVLLAASTGDYVFDHRGLSTVKCFEFLLSLPKGTKVGYGFNYDVNMMLRDLSRASLVQLWFEGRTRWNTYTIEWIPNKWVYVKAGNRRVKVSDVFGFFQTSFVNALRKWDIEPGEEIETMKQQRSIFDASMKQEIIGYCLDECRTLVQLMDELEIALDAVGLHPRSWVGAGSIASAMLQREGVKDHLQSDYDYPTEAFLAIRHAYFGGRSELFQQGTFPHLYDYDISSAYPSEAVKLPSLAGGTWKRVRKYNPDLEYAVWQASWDIDPKRHTVMPFPYRQKTNIYYPFRGRGWYHANEMRVATSIYPTQIRIQQGWVFTPATDERPFEFIPQMFQYRADLKRDGHAGEKVLKLGLNAIYGKLAQGYGYRGKPPPFQSYLWAGIITAGTRARILNITNRDPDSLVMVATDGIFFHDDPQLNVADGLGGLELTQMDDAFVAQPGVYATNVDGERIARCRGFFSKEINFDALRNGYESEGAYHVGSYESTRFCGLGSCVVLHDLANWRKWIDHTRKLSLYPSRKFIENGCEMGNPIRHYPPSMNREHESEPYRPKEGNVRMSGVQIDELAQYLWGSEQPLRDYE